MVYNNIMKTLEDFLRINEAIFPDIYQGVTTVYEKLKKYYAETDKSPIYSVATVVYPSMRFQYWIEENWGSIYEENTKESIRAVWNKQYAEIAIDLDDKLMQPLSDSENNDIELRLLGMTR